MKTKKSKTGAEIRINFVGESNYFSDFIMRKAYEETVQLENYKSNFVM